MIKSINGDKYHEIRICEICGYERVMGIHTHHHKKDRCWRCSQKERIIPYGKEHGRFKHGINQGYRRIKVNGKRVHEHRYILESYLGRQLKPRERVHHIDFNKLNNNINNLYLCTNSEHRKMTSALKRLGGALLNKLIWFDRKNKKYVLYKVINPIYDEPEIIFPTYSKKISIKKCQDGHFYPKCQIRRHKFISYYRIIMESFLKRKLKSNERIHHINCNHADNSINNLYVVSNKEHCLIEHSLVLCTIELYKKNIICFDAGTYRLNEV